MPSFRVLLMNASTVFYQNECPCQEITNVGAKCAALVTGLLRSGASGAQNTPPAYTCGIHSRSMPRKHPLLRFRPLADQRAAGLPWNNPPGIANRLLPSSIIGFDAETTQSARWLAPGARRRRRRLFDSMNRESQLLFAFVHKPESRLGRPEVVESRRESCCAS